MTKLALFPLLTLAASAAQVWTVRVEEPTGLYPRDRETVAVPLAKLGGHREGFTVTDSQLRELPWQATATELLFPASLIPGELPAHRIACCAAAPPGSFPNPILLRRVGRDRIEFGNPHFRGLIDLETGALVELYNLRAGPQRVLNLIETTPEGSRVLAGDVHESTSEARRFAPPPVPRVEGPNTGWTSLGAAGRFASLDLLESGPLRGSLRLTRPGETWEIQWNANAASFRWKAQRGFRLTAISALPYVPFNRCLDGSEYDWPTGPGEDEPAPHEIAPRDWTRLPGGHMVYYQREENYGALGIVALDPALVWKGACTRRVLAEKPEGTSEIAVTFPVWNGAETVLEARRENRVVRQSLLVQVTGPVEARAAIATPASRIAALARSNRAPAPFSPDTLPLDGAWELAPAEKGQGPPESGWRTVQVPGSVHTQWLPADKVFTREAEWVSTREWWYRKRFTAPERFRGRRVRLEFEATDYYADTVLNGVPLGRHEGYIDPYAYDAEALQPGGENILLVRVWTPVSYYWKHRPYTVKGAYGAVDQKPDDITPIGITRSVRLAAYEGPLIRDIAVNTRLEGEAAVVEVDLESDAPRSGHRWEVTLSPRSFTAPERYQAIAPAASGATRVTIPVPSPRLWWTRDHGAPNLYTLDVRLIDPSGRALDAHTQAIGIREITKIGWDFYLNRRKMFIRGTNYYYHLFMSEMTRAKYERDLDLMLGMNINMIRLHCHFSNREFYDLADEKGVLIWQDYLEAWYPHDRRFSLRAAELYDNHIRYVRNHPSVALWATSDEEDFTNYHDLTKHLAPRPALLDPERRPVVRSTGRFGDAHVYHGWYNGTIWEYTGMTEPFVSELGATSLPNYETLIQFMPDQWPIKDHVEEWTWRRLQIPEAMRAWGDPDGLTLQEYIPRTQAFVARLFQIAIERMRRRKAEGAGGILHFHAIDIWPSVTMAAIDFNRVPTKTYDTVRRSFEPVAALFEYDRGRWKPGETFHCDLWAVNDRWEPIPGAKLKWQLTGPAPNLPQGTISVSLRADSVARVFPVEFIPATPGPYQLRASILDQQSKPISENIYEFEVRP